MNKKTLQEVVRLTQECLAHYWQLDAEPVIRHLDRHVFWVGAAQDQYREGAEGSAESIRDTLPELRPCHMLNQEFSVVQNVGNACTVVGRYLTTTDEEAGYYLQVMQRCTFVWELVDGEPKIKHIHISNPMGELRLTGEELFPNVLGQMARQYWTDHWERARDRRRVAVKTKGGVDCFLSPAEVLYVMADGRSSVIHTTSGETLHACAGFRALLSQLRQGVIAVHRSYAVNAAYVASIRKYEITMTDGSKIPVPERRFQEIRDRLVKDGERAGAAWRPDSERGMEG